MTGGVCQTNTTSAAPNAEMCITQIRMAGGSEQIGEIPRENLASRRERIQPY